MKTQDFEKLLDERLLGVEDYLHSTPNYDFFKWSYTIPEIFKESETKIWGIIRGDYFNFKNYINMAIGFLIKVELILKIEKKCSKCSFVKCIKGQFYHMIESRFKKTRAVLAMKNAEYADGQDDKLYNFKRAAGITGESVEKALGGMMLKHEVSIWDIIEKKRPFTPEMIDEKFGDMINYLILLEAIITEKIEAKKYKDNYPAIRFAMALKAELEKPDFVGKETFCANCQRYMNPANPCKGCCIFCAYVTERLPGEFPFRCVTCNNFCNFVARAGF
jgi:hypothetical protein